MSNRSTKKATYSIPNLHFFGASGVEIYRTFWIGVDWTIVTVRTIPKDIFTEINKKQKNTVFYNIFICTWIRKHDLMQFHGTQQNIQIQIRIRFGMANSLNAYFKVNITSNLSWTFNLKYILIELTKPNLRLKYALIS